MQPKRTASAASSSKATKRQRAPSASSDAGTDPESDAKSDVEAAPRPPKKAKVEKKAKPQKKAAPGGAQGTSDLAPNGQPTNKVVPVDVTFPARTPGTTRIATWNLSGLAAAQKKGFKYYVEAEDPDIIVLTETKVNNEPADPSLSRRFPHRYWAISQTKGYCHPDQASVKGRIVTLEFDHCYLVGTYVVNAGQNLKTLEAKKEWNVHFTAYIRELDRQKPVVWTGDLNVAPTAIDLANPKQNWNKTPGYTEAETRAFARLLDPSAAAAALSESEDEVAGGEASAAPGKFVDVWRKLHPEERHYTYFSYRFNCRIKGIGWRLDMFVLSDKLVDRVKMCEIRSEIYGASDHCPVVLEIEGEL